MTGERMENSNRRDMLLKLVTTGAAVASFSALVGCSAPRRRISWEPGSWKTDPGASQPTPRVPQPYRPRAGVDPSLGGGASGAIPRQSWTSEGTIERLADPMGSIERITVHHDAIESSSIRGRAEAIRRLTAIRADHLRRGWADIGYHYIIDPQGNVWEGRPIRWQGAHVRDQNPRNLGIMVMGNFMVEQPSAAAVRALETLLADQTGRHRVSSGRVHTHRELGTTACPGNTLQSHMDRIRGGVARA